MSLGRNFAQALQKALRSIEQKGAEFSWPEHPRPLDELLDEIGRPHDGRLQKVQQALWLGATVEQDLRDHRDRSLVPGADRRDQCHGRSSSWGRSPPPTLLRRPSRPASPTYRSRPCGQSGGRDPWRAARAGHPSGVQDRRHLCRRVPAYTPYHYSSYDAETEVEPRDKEAVIILGSGPNRIGQGIEFDYSCVHATLTLREGVRGDHGQLQPRDRLDRLRHRQPPVFRTVDPRGRARGDRGGAGGRAGGRRDLPTRWPDTSGSRGPPGRPRCAPAGNDSGGDPPGRGARAFGQVLHAAGLPVPRHGLASSAEEARAIAGRSGIRSWSGPRTSSVAGAWRSCTTNPHIGRPYPAGHRGQPSTPCSSTNSSTKPSRSTSMPCSTGRIRTSAGSEHIEEAGIHSGDSACALPPMTLRARGDRADPRQHPRYRRRCRCGVCSTSSSRSPATGSTCWRPIRASCTVPFVSKATGAARQGRRADRSR